MQWIEKCVPKGSLAVLVNGSPTEFFGIKKGMRQGDPLSPLLFNICVNRLSCMLNQLLASKSPCGFRLRKGFWVNHLQFADDTLICCGNEVSPLESIAAVL